MNIEEIRQKAFEDGQESIVKRYISKDKIRELLQFDNIDLIHFKIKELLEEDNE